MYNFCNKLKINKLQHAWLKKKLEKNEQHKINNFDKSKAKLSIQVVIFNDKVQDD